MKIFNLNGISWRNGVAAAILSSNQYSILTAVAYNAESVS
jgi:hypothetical protein